MSRHTVTLLSCEACIYGEGVEEEKDRGLQGVRGDIRVAVAKVCRGAEGGRGTYIMETSRVIIPKELLVLQCGSGSEYSGWRGRGGDNTQMGGDKGGEGGKIDEEMLTR